MRKQPDLLELGRWTAFAVCACLNSFVVQSLFFFYALVRSHSDQWPLKRECILSPSAIRIEMIHLRFRPSVDGNRTARTASDRSAQRTKQTIAHLLLHRD